MLSSSDIASCMIRRTLIGLEARETDLAVDGPGAEEREEKHCGKEDDGNTTVLSEQHSLTHRYL